MRTYHEMAKHFFLTFQNIVALFRSSLIQHLNILTRCSKVLGIHAANGKMKYFAINIIMCHIVLFEVNFGVRERLLNPLDEA